MRRLRRDSLTPGLRGAIVAGVVLHIAGVALIGATWRLPAPPPDESPFVRLSDARMNERATMMDPGPLFLPTSLNYGADRAKSGAVIPYGLGARSGDPDEPPLATPRLGKPDAAVPPVRPEPVFRALRPGFPPALLVDALPERTADLFLAAGRRPAEVSALPPEGPRYAIVDDATGRPVASGPLPLAGKRVVGRFAPAEFLVEADGFGLSIPVPVARLDGAGTAPKAAAGTGDAATDARLAAAVAEALAKNPPTTGRYRVLATP